MFKIRLWHQEIISDLPRQQLLGQHRECCALRGKGWGKKHSVVDYVFTYAPSHLVAYHYLIMDEMVRRGYHPDEAWRNKDWRGNDLKEQKNWVDKNLLSDIYNHTLNTKNPIFIEHNNEYLKECIENLKNKGIILEHFKKERF